MSVRYTTSNIWLFRSVSQVFIYSVSSHSCTFDCHAHLTVMHIWLSCTFDCHAHLTVMYIWLSAISCKAVKAFKLSKYSSCQSFKLSKYSSCQSIQAVEAFKLVKHLSCQSIQAVMAVKLSRQLSCQGSQAVKPQRIQEAARSRKDSSCQIIQAVK